MAGLRGIECDSCTQVKLYYEGRGVTKALVRKWAREDGWRESRAGGAQRNLCPRCAPKRKGGAR